MVSIFFYFHPENWGNDSHFGLNQPPILRIIFFKWVETQPPTMGGPKCSSALAGRLAKAMSTMPGEPPGWRSEKMELMYIVQYTLIYIYIQSHVYIYIYIYIFIYLHIHTHTYIYINVYIFIYLHMTIYMNVFMLNHKGVKVCWCMIVNC